MMENTNYIYFVDSNGDDVKITAHNEICPRCKGNGKHSSLGLITSEEFNEWSPEEQEDYLNGKYDIVCENCKGENVVKVPNENDPLYQEYLDYYYAINALIQMEKAERFFMYGEE